MYYKLILSIMYYNLIKINLKPLIFIIIINITILNFIMFLLTLQIIFHILFKLNIINFVITLFIIPF